MKSRKSAKASKNSQRADRHRKALRGAMRSFETLEDRRLLTVAPLSDGFYYPPIGKATAYLPTSITAAQYAARSSQQFGSGSGSGSSGSGLISGLGGEGTQPFISAVEIEPNNNALQAQFVNLGTGPSQSDGVAIVGNLSVPVIPGTAPNVDEDYFAFDLRVGDILDARINGSLGAVFDLSIQDANRTEVLGTTISTSGLGLYPSSSPLDVTLTSPNVDLAFVVPKSGRYYARVSDGDTAYTLTLRARRPVLESEPVGTQQKVFLDFDGAFLRRDIFGAPGTARLSPLSNFLQGWGLSAADENRVIDRIIDGFKAQLSSSSSISILGANGFYGVTGIPGQLGVEVLNSRDHVDPFGQRNVTRIIIGGSIAEFLIPTIGLAQSIDVGNFATSETAVVLLDNIVSNFVTPIPRAGTKSAEDVIVKAIANVAVHELGHITGAWHTLNSNSVIQIMDAGGSIAANGGLIGVGPDGIFGTADDVVPGFGEDVYDGSFRFGRQDSAVGMAFGLATGTQGGATISGKVFVDNNLNRTIDAGDAWLPSVQIYADQNNNGVLDGNELRVLSDANGSYSMTVPPGQYIIREVTPVGFKLLSPSSLSYTVNLASGQVVTGRDFANERINQSITGMKWNDFNGNGFRDAGEPGIGGVYIYIDLDGDSRIDIGEPTAVTNPDGTYKLNFPGAGTFTIREVMQSGFTQSYPGPAFNNAHTVTLTGNPTIDAPRMAGLNFGNRITIDFGDAPASYGSASSGFLSGLTLGTLWDAEGAPLYSADAQGDDGNGLDDEDAIDLTVTPPLTVGSSNNPIVVRTTNTTGQTAYLQAWIDFNGDGDFNDADEQVVSNLPVTAAALPPLNITVPATAKVGNTFARLRLSTTRDVPVTGQSVDGEVEDYPVTIVSKLVAAPDQATVRRNSTLNFIDVLQNDRRFATEVLEVTNVSQPPNGFVTFTADGVRYTPKSGFIGRDSFTYEIKNAAGETATATVTVDVNLVFENPLAIDDSFDVPTNAIDFPLNVLANDIEGQNGALSILSVTPPDKGGVLSIATGNKSLRYTPSRDFGGTEFFTYTVADAAGKTSTAKGTIHTLLGDRADDKLQIRLVATNLAGTQISKVQQGQQFKIEMYVDDLRFDTDNPSPQLQAGVFAAYTDLLYNLQLVSTVLPTPSTPAGFNFAVNFFNNYSNGQTGDATIPGIIDELGAFYDGSNMNRPNSTLMASITFTAKAPGIANFLADPADVSPSSNSLLFDTSSTPVPVDQIQYLSTSLEIVGDGVVFPVAVDDSPTAIIPVSSTRFAIDVLSNDSPGSSGPVTLKTNGVSDGLHGTTRVNAGMVEYTPNIGYAGTDQFTYTIVDTAGNESVARVTVKVGANTALNDVIDLPLRVTDLSGTPITQITVGQQFQLRGYVKDLRTSGSRLGIFSAFQDIIYPKDFVSPIASTTNVPNLGFQVAFGPNYNRLPDGDIFTSGLINEIGALAASDNPTGTDEFLLFIVTMTANNVGMDLKFVGDPADISPFHDSLTYQPVMARAFDEIRYGVATLNVVNGSSNGNAGAEFTNANNPLDVNADGFVSPIDALAIINSLNSGGSRPLFSGAGEGELSSRLYVDTNADGFLSPIDVLNVINFLNSNRSGLGEGESSGGNASSLAGEGEYTDELFDDGVDDLVNQLAPDIEQTWKKQARS